MRRVLAAVAACCAGLLLRSLLESRKLSRSGFFDDASIAHDRRERQLQRPLRHGRSSAKGVAASDVDRQAAVSLSSSPLDVLFAVLFVPLTFRSEKKKEKPKHSLESYRAKLNETCAYLGQFGHRGAAVGDPAFIRSIDSCRLWLDADLDFEYRLEDMRHEEEASVPSNHSCNFKFGLARLIDARVNRIWLNKVEILSDLGDRHPDKRIFLVDADKRYNHDRHKPHVWSLVSFRNFVGV